MLEMSKMCSFKDLSKDKFPILLNDIVSKRDWKSLGDKDWKTKSVLTKCFIKGKLN